MTKKHSYLDQTKYRQWVIARDKALEKLHIDAQLQATDEMRNILSQVLLAAKANFHDLKNPMQPHSIDRLDGQIKNIMRVGAGMLLHIYTRLKVRSYILAKSSETEIVAQLNRSRTIHNKIDQSVAIRKQAEQSVAGGPLFHRLQLYLDRLSRKIISQAQTSALIAQT